MSRKAEIAHDPRWLAHRFDEAADAIRFRLVPREAHRAATFLTDEHMGEEPMPFVLPRGEAVALASDPSPVHFIFHSAFCGSTLLARAFDLPGRSMGLKEPQILNDVAGWRLRGAPGPRVAEALDHALRLLARPFEADEVTIIKPSNVLNGLAPAMLKLRPDARALLLRAPLPVFLKSIAKKGMWGRLWVRDLMAKQLQENLIDFGLQGADYLRLTDLQAAAIGWLAQQALFARLARDFPGRVATLDSETLLERPAEALAALSRLYGLPLNDAQIGEIVEGPAFANDSKTGDSFSLKQRAADYDAAFQAHADEIEKVGVWAEAVAKNAGVEMGDAAPLLA